MKILLLEKYPEIKKEYLNYLEKNNTIYEFWDNYDNNDIDVIIIRSGVVVNTKLLDNYPKLKYVARIWIWLDKVDLSECEKRWIKVLNTPWANSNSVADLVLAWVLNMARNLNKWFQWIENRFDYMWYEFQNKSVWIIWFGNIWKKVYDRFKVFWVKKFLIFDPFLSKEEVEKNKFCYYIENKEDIFKNSEIFTFHIPLLESTKDFLWKKEIKLLKSDVLLINTSRWWIINEKVLVHFLKTNPNSRFFADVWEEEPNDPKLELLDLENVLITPHIWAMTKQAEEQMHFFKELI
jgi:phosphoglycerate dehydrogenase-like enzyme